MPEYVQSIMSVLRDWIAVMGSQKALAERLKISPQYLSDIFNGRREISAKVAKQLGFKRVVVYLDERKKSNGV